jgi:hypothetical protein
MNSPIVLAEEESVLLATTVHEEPQCRMVVQREHSIICCNKPTVALVQNLISVQAMFRIMPLENMTVLLATIVLMELKCLLSSPVQKECIVTTLFAVLSVIVCWLLQDIILKELEMQTLQDCVMWDTIVRWALQLLLRCVNQTFVPLVADVFLVKNVLWDPLYQLHAVLDITVGTSLV